MEKYRKILLIQTAFTGDVVLATPVAEKLHAYYPEAKIDFLVRKGNEGLLTGHPFIHQVLVWDKKHSKLRNLLSLLRTIRSTRYDLVVNMHRFASSGLLAGFSKAKERIGFDKNVFAFRYTRKVVHEIGSADGTNKDGNGKHEVRRNLDLIAHLTDLHTQRPKLYTSESDRKIISYQKNLGPYVCLAPTSVWFTKQWTKEKWIELIRLIPETYHVYLLGGPGDAKLCDDILKTSGRENVANLCGQLSFLQSAALMESAKMNYVNDSAPMHFASAMNAPVTAIYCSTVPAFGFGPLSEYSRVVETEEQLPCRPCGLHGHQACPEVHFRCATSVDVKKVMGDLS